ARHAEHPVRREAAVYALENRREDAEREGDRERRPPAPCRVAESLQPPRGIPALDRRGGHFVASSSGTPDSSRPASTWITMRRSRIPTRSPAPSTTPIGPCAPKTTGRSSERRWS